MAALIASTAELTVGNDGEDWIIGRATAGIYVAVPEPGAVLIRALQRGASLGEATQEASAVAGEDVDVEEFLVGLAEAGILELDPADRADGRSEGTAGETAPADASTRKSRPVRWVAGIPQHVAAPLFGRTAWVGYGIFALLAATIFVAAPELRPTYTDVWFLDDWAVATLTLVPISLAFAALHEFWHYLAGRALGVGAVFRLSVRGPFLAFETDLTQLVAIPRRRRYGAFLAGMAIDTVVLALALLVRLAATTGALSVPELVDRLAAAIVFVQTLGILAQFLLVFLRSDCYAVLANALRCHNLYRATWLVAKRRVFRLTEPERIELAAISEHDRAVARWFSLVYLLGMLGVVWIAITWLLPSVVTLARWTVDRLSTTTPDQAGFWTAILMLTYLVASYLGPLLLKIRERRLRQQGRLL